jgi:hypothetical protein
MTEPRDVLEAEIGRALLAQWNPLGVPGDGGTHPGYARYAHEVYSLLARGASDMQITRALHHAERDELGHPELVDRDLRPLLRTLRDIEHRL